MSMLFLFPFVGVMLLLTLVAWADPTERGIQARARALRERAASGGASLSMGSLTAQLLKGERKIEKPCLTPIDCVMENRCAGHCGCR
jgi:hypothetical protein